MARATKPSLDPARDAAFLLGRIGFVLLFAAWVPAAFLGSGAVLVLLPIGMALVGAQTSLGGGARPPLPGGRRLVRSPALLAPALLLGWAGFSLLWSPAPPAAGLRLAAAAAVAALALAGYLVLPDRMRSANLYLLPVGAALGVAAAAALWLGAGTATPEAARRLERGLAILVLLAWPAIAWLRSRGRDVEAIGLVLGIAVAAALAPDPAPVLALACGALGYFLAQLAGRMGALGLGAVMGGLLLLAPLLALLAGSGVPAGPAPLKWLSGHGYGALPASSPLMAVPAAPALRLWFELGLPGALAAAAIPLLGLRAAARRDPALVPGVTAAFTTAFALALSGIDRGEAWWLAALAVAGLAFVGAERGQFRTRRPRALLFGRPRAP